jgi:hypothetical protein
MATRKRRTQRLVSICLLGCALLNFPLLSLFDVSVLVFGIPLLYGYIFSVWALLILLVGLVVRATPSAREDYQRPPE